MYALGLLHLIDELLKVGLGNFHNHVRVHLNESAVGIICKSGVAGLLRKSLNRYVV